MDLKSFEMFSREHQQSEKFDYFICTVAGALFAYIGQTYTPHVLNSWHYFIIPIALLTLTACFGVGLWIILISKRITRINKEVLVKMEESTGITDLLRDSPDSQTFTNAKKGNATRDELLKTIEINRIHINKLEKNATKRLKTAYIFEWVRNGLLAVGFLLIITSKVLQPYFP